MGPKRFVAELKRRHVYNVTVGYGVITWSLVQMETQIGLVFDLSRGVLRLIVLLLLFVGFPAAVGLAWAFDLTPDGVKRTEDLAPSDSVGSGVAPNDSDRSAGELADKALLAPEEN